MQTNTASFAPPPGPCAKGVGKGRGCAWPISCVESCPALALLIIATPPPPAARLAGIAVVAHQNAAKSATHLGIAVRCVVCAAIVGALVWLAVPPHGLLVVTVA